MRLAAAPDGLSGLIALSLIPLAGAQEYSSSIDDVDDEDLEIWDDGKLTARALHTPHSESGIQDVIDDLRSQRWRYFFSVPKVKFVMYLSFHLSSHAKGSNPRPPALACSLRQARSLRQQASAAPGAFAAPSAFAGPAGTLAHAPCAAINTL